MVLCSWIDHVRGIFRPLRTRWALFSTPLRPYLPAQAPHLSHRLSGSSPHHFKKDHDDPFTAVFPCSHSLSLSSPFFHIFHPTQHRAPTVNAQSGPWWIARLAFPQWFSSRRCQATASPLVAHGRLLLRQLQDAQKIALNKSQTLVRDPCVKGASASVKSTSGSNIMSLATSLLETPKRHYTLVSLFLYGLPKHELFSNSLSTHSSSTSSLSSTDSVNLSPSTVRDLRNLASTHMARLHFAADTISAIQKGLQRASFDVTCRKNDVGLELQFPIGLSIAHVRDILCLWGIDIQNSNLELEERLALEEEKVRTTSEGEGTIQFLNNLHTWQQRFSNL